MKALIPIDSKKENPTDKFEGNPILSNDYLVNIDGIFGIGQFQHEKKHWIVIHKFDCKLNEDLFGDKYQIVAKRRNDPNFIYTDLIWYKQVDLEKIMN